MSKIKLDLSKFKHISSNSKTTKLRHADGHFLVIANGALSKDGQEQLSALVPKKYQNGGEVDKGPKESGVDNSTMKAQRGEGSSYGELIQEMPADIASIVKNAPRHAQDFYKAGKEMVGMADGGKVKIPNTSKPADKLYNASDMAKGSQSGGPSLSQGLDNAKKEIKGMFGYADGGKVADNYGGGQNVTLPEDVMKASAWQGAPPTPPADDNGANELPYGMGGGDMLDKAQLPKTQQAQAQEPMQVTESPEVPKDTVAIQKLYNTAVLGHDPNIPGSVNENPAATFGPNGEPPKSFDAASYQRAEAQHQKMAQDAAGVNDRNAAKIEMDNAVRQRAGLPPMPVPGVQAPAAIPSPQQQPASQPQPQSMNPQAPQPQQNPMGASLDQAGNMLQQGYLQRAQGIETQKTAAQDLAQSQQEILDKRAQAQSDAQVAYKQNYDHLDAERQNHIQDIQNGYINPEQYWTGYTDSQGNKVDGHSKLMTAIGMLLGGFNPRSQTSNGTDFLKYNIDRNIDAQKTNLAAKQNLLSANLRQFGNLRDATDMTRIMMNDVTSLELQKASAKAANPAAKAAALDAIGKLNMESAQIFPQFAMRRAALGLSMNGGPQSEDAIDQSIAMYRIMNPEMAKEMMSRRVPGYGLGTVPVPEKIRDDLITKDQVDRAAKDLFGWAQKHTGSINPSDIAVGKLKSQALQSLYREAKLKTVYREGEQPLLDKVVNSDPTSFFNSISTLPKLKEIMRDNDQSRGIVAKQYGLRVPQPAQTEADIVTGKDGKKYRKQGNFMVPVK